MQDDAFDQIVSGLPRRAFLGLAAALSAFALGDPPAEARRKKRKKRKKCKWGTAKCGTTCVDLSSDNANCGSCGVVCTDGRSCNAGTCSCPADQSFIAGACIPRLGCTLELDTCEVGKKACPGLAVASDSRCHVSAEGEPFCATAEECVSVPDSSGCPTIGGKSRILIPCANCDIPGETGQCVLPVTQQGNAP